MVGKRRGRHLRNDLDAKKVAALIRKGATGRHFDGGGLHLLVKQNGAASWVLRVSSNGRRRDLGLGGADSVALADAREAARQLRATIKAGGDPADERRKLRKVPTFEQVARSVHVEHSPSWRNRKHAAQWLSTLQTYAFPEIGHLRIDLVGVPEVLRVLGPIWLSKPETARRVRQRLRTVLDVARAAGHRVGENPVGPVLAKALPRQTARAGHHTAMPYTDVPALVSRLDAPDEPGEITRLALRFLILTAARTSEVLGARRSEIDHDAAVWTIPAERMKAGREHRVPLSAPALLIVGRACELSADQDLLFPAARFGKPLSNMVLLMLLRRLGVEATAHGFRSSFRDWTAETTGFPSEVAEMALAHSIADKTEAAYRRGDLFEKRRALMDAWGTFASKSSGNVVVEEQRI